MHPGELGVVNPEIEVAGADIDPAHSQGAGVVEIPAQLAVFDTLQKDLQRLPPRHGPPPGGFLCDL